MCSSDLLVGFDTLTYRKDYDRSPILVGHQDSFLAPLPGSEALLVSGIGKERFYCRCCFYFCLLLCFVMEHSSLSILFGSDSTTTPVVDKGPPPTEIIPFKISMGIIDCVMNNRYAGDGTVHPGYHLLYIKELCELFKVVGVPEEVITRKLFSLSLKEKALDL